MKLFTGRRAWLNRACYSHRLCSGLRRGFGFWLLLWLWFSATEAYAVSMQAADAPAAKEYKRELVVALDGSGDYTSLNEAMEGIRAFMDYRVTVHIRKGIYREKWVVPSWIENVDFIGESADETIITYADHANIRAMGTFRTYTLKVEGSGLTFRNLTICNDAEPLGQAVALHTEGDRLLFIHCRFLGNQDTVYTGAASTRLYFKDCYIEGTTDFIFGPATARFDECRLHSKANSYITAASTPHDVRAGYLFYRCRLTAAEGVDKVYLGRPWRPYAFTYFIACEMGSHIRPEGWHNWRDPANERTARYGEYGSTGAGASGAMQQRVAWARRLTEEEVKRCLNLDWFFGRSDFWHLDESQMQQLR